MPQIRPASLRDIAFVETIDNATDYHEKASIHSEYIRRGRTALAVVDDQPVAYLRGGWLLRAKQAPLIEMLRVVPEQQRRGIGSELIRQVGAAMLEQGYSHLYAAAAQEEQIAHDFLTHNEFEPCGHVWLADQAAPSTIFSKDLRPDVLADLDIAVEPA